MTSILVQGAKFLQHSSSTLNRFHRSSFPCTKGNRYTQLSRSRSHYVHCGCGCTRKITVPLPCSPFPLVNAILDHPSSLGSTSDVIRYLGERYFHSSWLIQNQLSGECILNSTPSDPRPSVMSDTQNLKPSLKSPQHQDSEEQTPQWPRYIIKPNSKYKYPPAFVKALHMLGKKHVVIAGGTGYLAKMLKLILLDRGHGVSIITRQSLPMWPFNSQMARQWWEVTCTEKGIPPCDALVQLTGTPLLNKNVLTIEMKKELYESRSGIANLLAHQIPRMEFPPLVYIQASSTGIYPPSLDAEYDECYTGPPSRDLVGSVMNDLEKASDLFDHFGIRTVQCRLGHVLGDEGYLQQIHRIDTKGRFFWTRIGSGHQWLPWIHIADACNLLAHIIENDAIEGVVNAVAPERIRQEQFANALSDVLPFPTIKLPMTETFAHYLYPYRAEYLLQGRDVMPNVALEKGFHFEYPEIGLALEHIKPYLKPKMYQF